jgi:hypothetical protein
LERSSDQALHAAAEDIGSILVTLENLEYFGVAVKDHAR